MAKIKIKLTQLELKEFVLNLNVEYKSMGISTLEDLSAYYTIRQLFYRIHRSYSPERGKYIINLTPAEASVITCRVLPIMELCESLGNTPYSQAIASTLRSEIEKQVAHEILLINAVRTNE